MKAEKVWRLGMGDVHILPGSRHRAPMRKPMWIIVLVLFVCVFLLCAYIFPPQSSSACYLFSSRGCKGFVDWLPPAPAREYTDEEIASRVVIKDILNTRPIVSKKSKIAFMFLSPGSLPFEKLWDKFFQGHEGRFSVYVHASKTKPVHVSRYFVNRDIRSDPVIWGKISMVDAERRLLANALQDPDNQQFVLLSDSCVPLYHFNYIYDYLMYTNISFVDCFKDPGPHGNGRYSDRMLPEVEVKDFRKGAQWFSMKRQHAIIVMADSLYYSKFRSYCQIAWRLVCIPLHIQPGLEGRNCIADEHYLPTFLQMVDPGGIANWSVTHVDWSERKWHPKSYRARDVTFELLKNITSIDVSVHVTSDEKREVQSWPCLWNGIQKPCYLFARKFTPETLQNLLLLFSNYSAS
ncbi:glycosyltransferase BC10 isoform X1 [Cajanus cajan]|uniref:glycosyltransferase BC10 isoform X1 n=1 Tax=Cajanus cajan TaxID=3821 RepID=UPI00098D7E85|nr:glycosyltransferase BC10 isoform X1 [Cajanus cajan]XP_020227359.1 glycosyltransferase BC10 isoform X1 [Cajanus cajan]XP_029129339.1 glycosyltransferase BC10 isoform X1 [Cajanus cajan]